MKQGQRDRGTERQRDAVELLLRQAMPKVDEAAEAGRDLWPQMQARLRQEKGSAVGLKSVPWFDWALAGGVALVAVTFPAAVPVLLYYL